MKNMKLTGDYEKRRRELMDQYLQEVAEKVPEQKGTFDQRPDQKWREIDKKYIRMLGELIEEGVAAGEFEETETEN